MQLAARAALLYLNHAVLAKARGKLALPVSVRFGDASPELQVAPCYLVITPHPPPRPSRR
jgi:hypothetical protein